MIEQVNILKSSKKIGRHEEKIINQLELFFNNQGFHVASHARFNISWGNILSDIDLLVFKDNLLGVVEVKSSKDNLRRAQKQINKIKDYVDFVYVATDYLPRKFSIKNSGLIYVNGSINIIKEAKLLKEKPNLYSIYALPKKCLCRISEVKGIKYSKYQQKEEIARKLTLKTSYKTKQELKEIVTCGIRCDTQCPIWNFETRSE